MRGLFADWRHGLTTWHSRVRPLRIADVIVLKMLVISNANLLEFVGNG